MVDRQPTQIILSPAGLSRRYSKRKKPANGSARPKSDMNLKAIQERRKLLQAKIDKSRLPPLPTPTANSRKSSGSSSSKPSSSSSPSSATNTLSPNWKEKEQRDSRVGTPSKVTLPTVNIPKMTVPTLRLSPMIVLSQHTPSSAGVQHDPLPDIGQQKGSEDIGQQKGSEDPSGPKNQDQDEQLQMQEELQRQMHELMQQQMQKMQQYFKAQQEKQREKQLQEKEQLMQQLREQQEQLQKHEQEQEDKNKTPESAAENEDKETEAEDSPTTDENKENNDEEGKVNDENEPKQNNENGDDKENDANKENEEANENDKENGADKDNGDTNENEKNTTTSDDADKTQEDDKAGNEDKTDEADKKEDKKEDVKEEDEEDIGDLAEEIVKGLQSNDRRTQVSNGQKARELLSSPKPPVKQLIKAGILPVLVISMGRHDIPELQLEAAWAVTNIASGPSEHTWGLVEAGSLPVLIDLLSTGRENVREQAVWALGNIVGDGPDCRDQAIKDGLVKPLVDLLSPAMPVPLRRQVCWVLTNLFRVKHPDISDDDRKLCANALRELVSHYDNQVQVDSLWAVAYFADLGPEGIDDLIGCGIVRELVQRLYSNDDKVVAAALRATGTIVAGNNEQTDAVVDAGALPIYRELLKQSTPGIAREAAWILSNITAGTPRQIQLVIDVQAVSALIDATEKNDAELRKEATWALSNLTSGGTADQVWVVVQLGVLTCLCRILAGEDSTLMVVALEAIHNIFERSDNVSRIASIMERVGGLDTLRSIQKSDQGEVTKLANSLIEKHFEDEEKDDQDGEVEE